MKYFLLIALIPVSLLLMTVVDRFVQKDNTTNVIAVKDSVNAANYVLSLTTEPMDSVIHDNLSASTGEYFICANIRFTKIESLVPVRIVFKVKDENGIYFPVYALYVIPSKKTKTYRVRVR